MSPVWEGELSGDEVEQHPWDNDTKRVEEKSEGQQDDFEELGVALVEP